jgi:hypothetical protein
MDIELTDKACCSLLVWTNGLGGNDVAATPLKPGTRTTYPFGARTQFVHFLRVGFAGHSATGDDIRIHRIWTARGDRDIDELSPAELRQLGVVNAELRSEAEGATLRATADFPYFETQAGLVTDAGPRRLFFIELGEKPLHALAGLMLLGVVMSVLVAIGSWRHLAFAIGLIVTLLAVRELPSLEGTFDLRDDVSEAVGYSPYHGAWKIRDRALLAGSALLAFVIPVAVWIAYRLLARLRRADIAREPAPARRRARLRLRAAMPLIAAPVVVLGLLGMPDLKDRIGFGRSVEYVPVWDENNFIFWRYMIRRTDLVAMKDFFWLYGFQWIFEVGAPWGPLAGYAVFLSFWAFVALGSYWTLSRFFAGRSLVLRYLGLMAVVLVITIAGLLPFSNRYVSALAALLLYAGIESTDRLFSVRRIVFGVVFAGVALFEPAQALYALVPIGFLVLIELALEVPRRRPDVLRWLGRAAATVGLPIVAAVAVYAATGTLRGNVDYYREIDAINSSDALPAAIKEWLDNPRTLDAFVVWAVPVTIAVGMLGLLFGRGRARLAQAVVVAAGLLALMVMQKQILRPHVSAHIWLTCLYGLALWAVLETSLHSIRRWMGVAATGGVIFAVVLMSGQLRTGLSDVAFGASRAFATADATINRRAEFTADARAEFDLDRFENFDHYRDLVVRLRGDQAVRSGGQIWVLGDEPVLPVAMNRAWPYYFFEFYDTSPISFQRDLIEQLEDLPPERVVWNFGYTEFDTVPHTVRVPLLYAWTVRRFGPLDEVGPFAILRPLRAGEQPHFDWWRERLGSTVALGHVPEVAKTHGAPCSDARACETYLVIEYEEGATPPPELVVPIRVAGRPFEVRVATSPDSTHYVVRLDRLWFWAAAPPGSSRRVDTSGLAGAKVRLERRTADDDSLY